MPADEPEYEHGLSLPDPMRTILCLQIHLRVLKLIKAINLLASVLQTTREILRHSTTHPVLVVEYDCVCCSQIDAEPACSRAQEEQTWCVWRVAAFLETVHFCAAFQRARRPVNPAQWPALVLVRPVLACSMSKAAARKGISAYLDDVEHGDEL